MVVVRIRREDQGDSHTCFLPHLYSLKDGRFYTERGTKVSLTLIQC